MGHVREYSSTQQSRPPMTTIEIDLRDLPADVQDILRDRAIKESRPMPQVIKDYVLESARVTSAGT